jgi:hypothetical protein
MEDDWGLFGRGDMKLPVFSARTFLGEAEMRPVVWIRWRNDPNCRMI